MAKITWLGEDEEHKRYADDGTVISDPGPSFTTWGVPPGRKFHKGVAVEVTNPVAIEKAKGNRFFKVEEDEPKKEPLQLGMSAAEYKPLSDDELEKLTAPAPKKSK